MLSSREMIRSMAQSIRMDEARASPLGMAILTSRGKYKSPKHIQLINQKLLDLEQRKIRRLAVFMPPRHAKQLADDTPILTPLGWRLHGELVVGDEVFSPSGRPVKIIRVSEKTPCDVIIKFSNGEAIECNQDHEWRVYDRTRGAWKTVATRYWLSTTKFGERRKVKSHGRAIYQLPLVAALEFPSRELPLHPYVLGAWLGDGSAGKPVITHDPKDQEVVQAIEEAGYPISARWAHGKTGVLTTSFAGKGSTRSKPGRMTSELRLAGVLNEKHIPELYLRSSVTQRLQLLAGLVDTDGHVDSNGRVRFVNTNKRLADGCFDLAKSLGFRPYLMSQLPGKTSLGKKKVWTVGFQPNIPVPTRIKRKATKILSPQRMVGIESVELGSANRQGHCITVDSQDGLYVAGRTLIATHNSTMCSLAFPSWYLGNHPDHRFILATHTSDFAALWGRRVRGVINEYGQSLFGIQVSQNSQAANEWELRGHLESGMVAVGIGKAVVGRGANVLAIDDPVADAEQALSPTIREKHWDWYCSVADSRLEPNAIEVLLMTLWHPDDLGSRILKAWGESPLPFEVLRFPAIAETDDILGRHPGEALWPERFNIADLEEKKRKSAFWWDALYQQHPTPEGGAIFKVDWFRSFKTVEFAPDQLTWQLETGQLIFQKQCVTFMVVDPALGKTMHGDETAISVFAFEPRVGDEGSLLVLQVTSERIPVHLLIERVEEIAKAWGVQWVGMEANGFQMLLAQSARKEIGVTVRELDPQGRSKLSRAVPSIERAANGNTYLPEAASWLSKFLVQHCDWTGQDGDVDDIIDTHAYAAIECRRYGGKMEVVPRKAKPALFDRRRGGGLGGKVLFGPRT